MLTGAEAKLFARAARDGLAALPEERHLHRRFAVDGCGQLARVEPAPGQRVHHRSAIRRCHERARHARVAGLRRSHLANGRLPVVGEDDQGVAVEELLEPSSGGREVGEPGVCAAERSACSHGPGGVRRVVVVRQVVDEEVETVPGDEPTRGGGRVGVHGSVRPAPP